VDEGAAEDSAAEDADQDGEATVETHLTEIETELATNNARLHRTMIAKGARSSKVFEAQELATLFIPIKLRLRTENTRLVVCVIDENCAGYRLLSRYVVTSTS
jgi:hypothetical protein